MQKSQTGIIDRFTQLPLFMGMDPFDVASIVSWVELDFHKYQAGEIIAECYSPCERLIFVLDGSVERRTQGYGDMLTIIEPVPSPAIIQIDSLFGLGTRYTSQFKAVSETGTVSISKKDVLQLLSEYEVFRINFINMLSLELQMARRQVWLPQTGTLRTRMIRLIQAHLSRQAGAKTVIATMQGLASILQTTRARISQELRSMQEDGLLSISKSTVHIPEMRRLLEEKNNQQQ